MTRPQARSPSPTGAARRGSESSRSVPVERIVRPLVTVDVVIFSIRDDVLSVLLVQRDEVLGEPFPGRWALPGGFVDVQRDGSIEDCARRKLMEKTGVSTPYLEQLGSWGSAARDPRDWSVTTVYFALIASDASPPARGSAPQRWFPIEGGALPAPLAFDHGQLLEVALARLRSKVEYTVLPASLLPSTFTLPQLQHTFEIVLGRELDKSAFRTRLLSAGVIEETGEFRASSRRPAALYRLADSPAHPLPAPLRRG
jgi:8-oxo-dGTP diphosphatase